MEINEYQIYWSNLSSDVMIKDDTDLLRFYLFLEWGEGREKEREKNIDVWVKNLSVASHKVPCGGLGSNPGMCPDWESNWRPFGS